MEKTYFTLMSYGTTVGPKFDTATEAYNFAINKPLNRYETTVFEYWGDGSDSDEIIGKCSLDEALEYNYQSLDF